VNCPGKSNFIVASFCCPLNPKVKKINKKRINNEIKYKKIGMKEEPKTS
jgi:hypothetical protein